VSLAGTYAASATTNNNVTVSSNIVTINLTNCNNNAAPLVSILSPANNSSFVLGSTTTVQVDAQDTDGSIALVELYRNNVLVGSLVNPPFVFNITNQTSGNYTLLAKAYDNANANTNSALVNVIVPSPNTGLCGYPLWNTGTIYNTNDTVSYNNIIYRAKYWTQGNAPSTHYGNCCVWDLVMPCGGYTAATCFKPVYDSLIAYNANQEVFLNGNIYKAKWWTLNQNPLLNSGSGDVWLLLTTPCVIPLTLKLFMQGYYSGAGNMLPVLQNQNQLSSSNQCDTVQINFYQAVSPYYQLHTCKGIVHTNGWLSCELPTSLHGNSYYLSVKHRNSIETWSADPVLFTFTNSSYDFSVQATKAFGANQIEMAPGIFALYTGDINQDGVIDGLDFNDWENDNNSFAAGYLSTDLNGDGVVDGLDFMFCEMNSNLFVGTIAP
jgi:chitodextrinase